MNQTVEDRVPAMRVRHPLDPLSAEEIRAAAAVVRAEHPQLDRARFSLLLLREPAKEAIREHARGGPAPPRRAFVVVLERGTGRTYEGVVDLASRLMESWEHRPGVQPGILPEEFASVSAAILSDPEAQAILRRRGATDLDLVQLDPWAMGSFPIDGVDLRRRLLRVLAYVRTSRLDNGYARPIENLVFIVDTNTSEIVKTIEGEPIPLPEQHANYDAESVGALRTDLRPIEILQPDGASFTVDGQELSWQRWRMHLSLDPVEGLVLRRVAYEDEGRERSVLYRAAVSEMVVPYGDPSETFFFRNVFDAGEYHLGKMVGPLALGCDCLGEITYLDAVLADEEGEPFTIRNAICIHEEDAGILWKHWDFRYTEHSEVRRSRRLVVSTIATVGNYEYGFYWYFYLDGSIEFEIKLTGILQPKAVAAGGASPYGTLVAPGLEAPNHQHLFNVRLDMEVDGPQNSVYESDAVALPRGPDNPHGNAFVERNTLIARESEGERTVDPLAARTWRVVNPHVTNSLGQPVAYKLVPHVGPVLLGDDRTETARRGGFARSHLWVTCYEPCELHAAGDYPNQSTGNDGLPTWIERDRGLEDADVVLWHTLGTSHLPRPEEWPVMPVERLGFALKPAGFFDRNPALDVPPQPAGHCPGGDKGAAQHES